MNILEKYRPRTIADILGQPWVSFQLTKYLEAPYSVAFIFDGGTGTGKTACALLMAEQLGVNMEEKEFGGLHQIASGEQTGETVRRTVEGAWVRPFFGSGWHVIIVNEADCISPNAGYVWLDVLENLPPRTCVIFTTNNASKLPRRLRDRCECLSFESSALLLAPALQELVDKVWKAETGQDTAPAVESFGPVQDEDGNASFRRTLQRMVPYLRSGNHPATVKAPEPVQTTTGGSLVDPKRRAAALRAWVTIRAKKKARAS